MRIAALGALLLLSFAATARAQRVDGDGVPYRAWDLNAGIGLHLSNPTDAGAPPTTGFGDGTDGTAVGAFDLGYYWSSHLKTEFGVLVRPDWDTASQEFIALPDGRTVTAWNTSEIALTQFSGGLTWQFLENTFAHPYVTAGVRVGVASTRTVRETRGWILDGRQYTTYPLEPFEDSGVHAFARPYVAGGFKSYFSERVFVRPELATAFDGDGASQWTLRVGFGVDF